jgi:ABC-type antimicrobial peptide transport system permease subunit
MQSRMPENSTFEPALFVPLEQQPVRTLSFAARVDRDPMALASAARQAVWAVDPDQPVVSVQTLRQAIDTSLAGPRVIAIVLTMMGAAAVILSAIGMHGMIAHDVAQRRREMGIRLALGAAPRQVVAAIVRRGVGIAGVGIAIGLPVAWALGRVIDAALPGVATMRFGWIAILIALLGAIAALSSGLPAINASRIRPARVLQTD